MESLFILNEVISTEKRTVAASKDFDTVMKFLQEHKYLTIPDNVGNGFEIMELKYDEFGNARASLILSQIKKGSDANIKLVKGKTYNLVVGMHIGGVSDVMYLSNMACVDVNEDGYTLQGMPGSIGSMQEPIFVYKDEVFDVFNKDLYDCISH